jgi:hypothetical protein
MQPASYVLTCAAAHVSIRQQTVQGKEETQDKKKLFLTVGLNKDKR